MNFFWFVRFLLTIAFAPNQVWSLPLACIYNETFYREGETVKTNEPCLSCTCRKGSLNCNLRVCSDAPEILSPGCFLVRKASDCCPQMLCEENYDENGIEIRTAYKTENATGKNDCIVNGSIYAEGSAVGSSELCEYCYCIRSEIKCIRPRCMLPMEGCKPVHREPSCCPTHYDCGDETSGISTTESRENHGCERNGVWYEEGEIVPSGGPGKCESCYCVKREIQCAPILCPMERNFEECRPLTLDDKCCPSGFSCDGNARPDGNETVDEGNESETNYSTVAPEKSTGSGSPVEDGARNSTDPSFQSENRHKKPIFSMEMTTESDATFSMSPSTDLPEFDNGDEGEKNLGDEISGNSSRVSDDYDNYDYIEPTLPPSLPNLVIFPFVAADAVDKEENPSKTGFRYSTSSNNANQPDFYAKDFFVPPVRTEGGFVPKNPHQHLVRPFYDSDRANQNYSPPAEFSKTKIVPESSPTINGSISSLDSSTTETHRLTQSINMDAMKAMVPAMMPAMVPSPPVVPQKAKPVTIAYKNVVLDYYPDYRIVTPSGQKGSNKSWATENVIRQDFSSSGEKINSQMENLTEIDSTPTDESSSPAENSTEVHTAESSFLTDFLKTLFEEEPATTTAAATTAKFSSQQFSPIDRSSSSEVEEKVEGIGSGVETVAEARFPVGTTQEVTAGRDDGSTGKIKKDDKSEIGVRKTSLENFFKLAGCNIYGRMYRVGRIIAELSGPCQECVCTESGVQCSPLICQ